MFRPSRLILCLGAITLMIGAAQAQPTNWFLQGVVFDDTGSASGGFAYNFDTNTYSDINITTTAGTIRTTGATYHFVAPGFPHNSSLVRFVTMPDAQNLNKPGFTMFFPDPGDPGLDRPLFGTSIFISDENEQPDSTDVTEDSNESTCADATCATIKPPTRFVSRGSVGSSEPLFEFMFFGG